MKLQLSPRGLQYSLISSLLIRSLVRFCEDAEHPPFEMSLVYANPTVCWPTFFEKKNPAFIIQYMWVIVNLLNALKKSFEGKAPYYNDLVIRYIIHFLCFSKQYPRLPHLPFNKQPPALKHSTLRSLLTLCFHINQYQYIHASVLVCCVVWFWAEL